MSLLVLKWIHLMEKGETVTRWVLVNGHYLAANGDGPIYCVDIIQKTVRKMTWLHLSQNRSFVIRYKTRRTTHVWLYN